MSITLPAYRILATLTCADGSLVSRNESADSWTEAYDTIIDLQSALHFCSTSRKDLLRITVTIYGQSISAMAEVGTPRQVIRDRLNAMWDLLSPMQALRDYGVVQIGQG